MLTSSCGYMAVPHTMHQQLLNAAAKKTRCPARSSDSVQQSFASRQAISCTVL